MKINIFSVGQLLEKGYVIHMDNLSFSLRDAQRRLIAKIKMDPNPMFPLRLSTSLKKFSHGLVKNELWKWHLRFGHLNFRRLKLLSNISMVNGLPIVKESEYVCEACILGKQQRNSFLSGKSWRATKPL